MKKFRQGFCEDLGCRDDQFTSRVFWHCLYRRAFPFAPFLIFFGSSIFDVDRELINAAGRATNMRHVRELIGDHFTDSTNRGWWRKRASLRISTYRLNEPGRRYGPDEGSKI